MRVSAGFACRDVLDGGCHTQLVDKVADGEKHHLLRHAHHRPVVAVGARMDDAVHVQVKVICVTSGQVSRLARTTGRARERQGSAEVKGCAVSGKRNLRCATPPPFSNNACRLRAPHMQCRGLPAVLLSAVRRCGERGAAAWRELWAYFDLCFLGSGKGATAIDCSPNSGMQASAVTFWLMAG